MVSGDTGNAGSIDRDSITLTVPTGAHLVPITVLNGTTSAARGYWLPGRATGWKLSGLDPGDRHRLQCSFRVVPDSSLGIWASFGLFGIGCVKRRAGL